MKPPLFLKNAITWLYKSYHPRVTEASVMDYSPFGVPSEQDLTKNIEATQYSLWPYICINRIAQDISGLPLKFHIGYGDKKKDGSGHPIADLIYRPNQQDTHRDLWESSIWFLLATGATYWATDKLSVGGKIVRNGARDWKKKTELWSLPADRVQPKPEKESSEISYLVTMETGRKVQFAAAEVIRFKKFNPKSQYYGLAPMTLAMRTLAADFYARDWNRRFFKNDASPGVMLSTDQRYDETTDKRIRENWNAEHQGHEKKHRLAIFWNGLKMEGDGKRNPKDLDWANLIKLNREEVIALFGVPPAVVGLFEYANYANALMQKKEFWLETLIPLILHFETTLNELVFPRWTEEELWIEFDISGVEALQEDFLRKAQIQRIHWTSNMKTMNELRAEENLPEVEDGNLFYKDTVAGPFGPENIMPDSGTKKLTTKAADRRLERWAAKDIGRRRLELDFLKAMNSFFDQQWGRVKEVLGLYAEDSSASLVTIDSIFDDVQEVKMLREVAEPLIRTAVEKSGQAAVDEVSSKKAARRIVWGRKQDEDIFGEVELSGIFDLNDPNVVAWIEKNVARHVGHVTETTKLVIRDIIARAQDEGWSIQRLATELSDTFDAFSRGRSFTIAQTEMGAAANAGTFAGYEQMEVKTKEWLATPDERVRETHMAAMEAGPIPMGEKFKVGADMLDFPGDPTGSPEEIINCRCALSGE